MYRGRGPSLLGLLYVVIGVFVAADHKYFRNIDDVESIISLLLAVFLWPLLLLDVNLRIQ